MAAFHETICGKRFFEAQLPRLIKELGRIADALEMKLYEFFIEWFTI